MNPQLRRLALDLGPLLIFFGAFKTLGIFGATAAFMAAVLVALAIGYALRRNFPPCRSSPPCWWWSSVD